MGNFYVTQTLWAKEGKRSALRELDHAKKLVDRSGTLMDSWYERWFGKSAKPIAHYRLKRRIVMR
ncbi:hypothetical protein COV82_00560 [Candidatus Peregrinibacteria bacterium CG11_big_fil_rev_8_21_14_0_20_46_8]|nr:MAG: hypothetical protein COV82_00560 [Candidatus Peregrinibacteria bacterium CG11_big_fil_rev_8_21_14_0_20_46_8]